MAASLSLTQLSSGNPVYEKYYRQVDLSNTGRVGASDAALFLKKSGLADLVLGKIWDLADAERKGFLNKREFFIALRLVACAQNGLDVSLSSLHLAVVPPKFHDTSSPQLVAGAVPIDVPWAVKPEEKVKFDAIFESLSPVNGMLSGDKVKPVLLNSKLPVDVLGRVWELSDIDRDGMLDRDEFAVAMYLVYRALEKEPVPMSLPASLVPPSKRKKSALPSVVPLLPSPPSAKELRQSLPAGGMLPSKSPPVPIAVKWVVSPADRAKYDEVFLKTDKDQDGLVSGPEVRDIFLKTGLPSSTLADIWELCDTKDCGKLSKEQFALALHLINQKLTKGVDPPQALTGDMIPPSDRLTHQGNVPSSLVADFSAIKELDSLSNEIVDLQREKTTVEQDIKENEDSIKQRTNEVQELQDEVARESEELQRLQAQRQEIQEVLGELDQQKTALEEQLSLIRQQSSQESQLISSLQAELSSQQSRVSGYEEELGRAQEELRKLQLEMAQMEQKVEAGKVRLEPLQQELHSTQQETIKVQSKLSELQEAEEGVKGQLTWRSHLQSGMVNGTSEGERAETPEQQEDPDATSSPQEAEEELYTDWDTTKQADTPAERSSPVSSCADTMSEREVVTETASIPKEESFDAQPNPSPQQASPSAQSGLDFFQSDPFTDNDPFKDDPFGKVDVSDPFGGDPFKGTDPFASDSFFKQPSADPFSSVGGDPFRNTTGSTVPADSFGAAAGNTGEPDLFSTTSSNTGEPDLFNTGEPDLFNTGETDLFNTGEPDLFNTAASKAGEPDLFGTVAGSTGLPTMDVLKSNDPFAPGGTAVYTAPDAADPFASFFGNDSFGSGFADFSTLSKSNGPDPFSTSSAPDVFSSKNVFAEEVPKSQDTPPALPPKIGTPTRPPPPPPGKRSSLSRSESSDSYKRSNQFQTPGLGDPSQPESQDEKLRDPFSTSSPSKAPPDPANFSSINSYPTEEDLIEWAKRESEREEKERLARLTQQEQEDLELAIALSKSEISEPGLLS
ncbi:epidermal growth factor receptor substrate 15-like isoform X2 [Polyodon spathula]|uniref:epidermal growth factor receptor substrate 15-like isoform X2 n=1 Tax=Polyodon spathula TaxID=7913 RepID=UPI001B7F1E81|nr:epidermal growth factor receptor substrate 15-like isoform X2 [Polyodon spathula]